MRIIGGEFRGRHLVGLGKGDLAAHLRPTTDRIRESLFNVLAGGYGDPVTDAVVLDLFAGTGALGLEALSRGAAHVTFVENGRKSLEILMRNLDLCGVKSRTTILRTDARNLPQANENSADLVFLDPPYGKGLGAPALSAARASGWIAPEALIVWEDNAKAELPPGFAHIEDRRFGNTVMSFAQAVEAD